MADEAAAPEKEGGSKKKLIIIILAVLIVGGGVGVALMPGDKEEEEKKEEAVQDSSNDGEQFLKAQEKFKLLMVNLGEINCTLSNTAVADTRRKRIKLQPVLLLKPWYDLSGKNFDEPKNTVMKERFTDAIPLLRDIVISTVNKLDSTQVVDSRDLARQIRKEINGYDEINHDTKRDYKIVFGRDRVMQVKFSVFEPR